MLWCVSVSDGTEIMTSKPKMYLFWPLRLQFVNNGKHPSLTFMYIGKQCPIVCRQNETIKPEHYVSWQPWVRFLLPIKENSLKYTSFITLCVCFFFMKVGNWGFSCCSFILWNLMNYGLNFIKSRKEGRMEACVRLHAGISFINIIATVWSVNESKAVCG